VQLAPIELVTPKAGRWILSKMTWFPQEVEQETPFQSAQTLGFNRPSEVLLNQSFDELVQISTEHRQD
jgi:hypothetical protein